MILQQKCMVCGRTSEVRVTAEDYRRYMRGALVQVVWPDWTPDQRELLMTGIHPECWELINVEEDEDGDIE